MKDAFKTYEELRIKIVKCLIVPDDISALRKILVASEDIEPLSRLIVDLSKRGAKSEESAEELYRRFILSVPSPDVAYAMAKHQFEIFYKKIRSFEWRIGSYIAWP